MSTDASANDFRCGSIAIIGRPNVGKSTLLNALIGQKISITSRKPQTTRHRITGILTTEDTQYIFVDTPGFQTRHINPLNRNLNQTVSATLAAVDLIVFVIEAGRFTTDDEKILAQLPQHDSGNIDIPVLLIANKTDRIASEQRVSVLLPFMQSTSQHYPFTELLPICAKQARDIQHLLQVIRNHLPIGQAMYSETDITDRSERFYAAEILREKIFRLTGDELPYSSTVLIEKFEHEANLCRVFATILVARSSHKAMIIGNKGSKLKQISTDARLDMEKLFQTRVYLEVWIKVKSGWADDDAQLKSYGYE